VFCDASFSVSVYAPQSRPSCRVISRRSYARSCLCEYFEQEKGNCYTSAIVIAQLAYWVRSKRGKQRDALQAWLTRLIEALHGRILGFNVSAAHVWAEQQHKLEERGQPMPVEDSDIGSWNA
jgi:predicted nucleic acid-binding protein